MLQAFTVHGQGQMGSRHLSTKLFLVHLVESTAYHGQSGLNLRLAAMNSHRRYSKTLGDMYDCSSHCFKSLNCHCDIFR